MRKKQWIGVFLSLLLVCFLFPGCAAGTEATNEQTGENVAALFDPGYSDRDYDGAWDEASAVLIAFDGDTIRTAEGSDGVEIDGSTLTISEEGTYVLSGTLSNGQVIVDATETDKIQIVLNDVELSCAESAPIYVKQADKVFLTLAQGSENKVTDGETYIFTDGENEPDGAIFSKDDLTVNGAGSLTVSANYKDGIVSKDDLVVTATDVTVTAVGDGLQGKDSVAIDAGKLTVAAGADGIKSTNDTDETKGWVSIDGGEISITSANDGIQAETNLQITEGTLTITAGGGSADIVFNHNNGGNGARGFGGKTGFDGAGFDDTDFDGNFNALFDGTGRPAMQGAQANPENTTASAVAEVSTKGLKAGGDLYIADGTISVDSADDAIHSNANVTIMAGTLTLATGDDGVHANDALLIEGGKIEIGKSYESLEGATITINGGEIDVTAADDALNAAGGSDAAETVSGAANGATAGTVAGAVNGAVNGAANPGARKDEFAANDDYFIRITGGTLTIDAEGDGIDSNGNLYVTGGKIIVNGPTGNGNGILDYNGSAEISGGTFIGAGSSGMLQLFADSSSQNTLAVTYTAQQEAGRQLTLKDQSGSEILSFTPAKTYQTVIISSAKLQEGASYTLTGAATGTSTGNSKDVTITISGVSTSINEDGSINERQGGFGTRGQGSSGNMRPEGMPRGGQ